MGRYAGLNLAYSADWMWRIESAWVDGALRQVELGVYVGLELAFFVDRGGWGDTPG